MKLTIVQDEDPESPREWDNLGKMVCFHDRYNLGDDHDLRTGDFEAWAWLKTHLQEEEGAIVILPLYLYDHSGLTMSTSPFSCPWDSGQVGFIYTTKPSAKLTAEALDQAVYHAREVLESEVKAYDQFLRSDVWGYVIEDDEGNHVDSCWGLFGREYAEKEGQRMLEWHEDELKGMTPEEAAEVQMMEEEERVGREPTDEEKREETRRVGEWYEARWAGTYG